MDDGFVRTVKWNGKSLFRLNNALDEAARNAGALSTVKKALEAAREEAELDAARELLKLVELEDVAPEDLYLGTWACEDSPTGRCVYNKTEDVWLDECLICGDPSERK